MRDFGTSRTFPQGKAANALFLDELAARRHQRLAKVAVVIASRLGTGHSASSKIE
jgi:hypothetical protein